MNRRRWIILTACGLVALVITGAMLHQWRLKRAVRVYARELKARGEPLAVQELAPRTTSRGTEAGALFWAAAAEMQGIPGSLQPSRMRIITPGKAVVSWQHDLLMNEGSTNLSPELTVAVQKQVRALQAACDVANADSIEFNLDYPRGYNLLSPHLGLWQKATRVFCAATVLELHQRHFPHAWRYLRTATRMNRAYVPEPTLVSHLVHIASGSQLWALTWEALQHPGWSDAQLAELQQLWMETDFLRGTDTAFGMERAFTATAIRDLRKSQEEWVQLSSGAISAGSGGRASTIADLLDDPPETVQQWGRQHFGYWPWRWWDSYEEELFSAQVCQASIEASRSLQSARSYQAVRLPETIANLASARPHAAARFVTVSWHDGIAERFFAKAVVAQTQREMMVAAIALHRHRLQHGNWPTNLAQLVPAFLSELPHDFIDGQPLRYKTKPSGGFLLYSVGKDMEDDGGNPSCGRTDPTVWHGEDWVWPEVATAEEIAAFWEKKCRR